jgi:lipid-binding SYLF domain-containing protein
MLFNVNRVSENSWRYKMKKSYLFLIVGSLVMLVSSADTFAAKDFSSTIDVFKESPKANQLFEDAYGYAVFPTVGEGAAIIGATYGKGQLYQGDKLAGDVTLTGLSIGPQIGGDAFSEIIFFKDKDAYDKFASGKYNFNAKASVNAVAASAQVEAGELGTYASANTTSDTGAYTASYDDGVAVLVRGKNGLMAKASVGGQHFSVKPFHSESNKTT